MNSLEKIQRIVKIIRVITIVVFTLDIIAIIMCIPVLILLFCGSQFFPFVVQLVNAFTENTARIDKATVYAAVFVLLANCASGAILCHSVLSFAKREITSGTPFTSESADGLFHLGLIFILLPLTIAVVCSIGLSIGESFYPEIERVSMGDYSTGIVGLMLLLLSLLCRSAAEIQSQKRVELE